MRTLTQRLEDVHDHLDLRLDQRHPLRVSRRRLLLTGRGHLADASFSYTLPTILTQLGYKAETAQLMTVPL
jgi:hypothetical protein